jgi:hypothetical protein
MPLTFGIGADAKVNAIEVAWPGGKVEKFPGAAAGSIVTIVQGKGIAKTERMQ